MVTVPEAGDMTKQADIVMPGDLVDEAEYCLTIESNELWDFFENATHDQRRAMVYIQTAYNQEIYPTEMILFAPGHAEGNESNFNEIAEAMDGVLLHFDGYDFMIHDTALVKFADVATRQAAADLADKILKRYSDEVWYIEFNRPSELD